MEETRNQNNDVFFMSDALVGVLDPDDLEISQSTSEKSGSNSILETAGLKFVSYEKEKSKITVCGSKKFAKSSIVLTTNQSFKKKFFGLEFEMSNEILEVRISPEDSEFLVTLKVVQIREV